MLALVASSAPAIAPSSSTPAFTIYAAPGGMGGSAGEPSLSINPLTNAAFLQAGSETLRVLFDETTSPATAHWHNVASTFTSVPNVDPIGATDKATGRTFSGGLENDCSLLAFTDDDGASWTPMVDTCTAPAFDHETIGSGPYHDPAPPAATYPRALYYCAQGVAQECAVSWNGGITFNAPVVISTSCTGAVGHVKVSADGTAYVPSKGCGSTQAVMSSANNGLLWTTHAITGSTAVAGFNDPSVATTPSGWVYAAWIGSDRMTHVSLSKTSASSWSAPMAPAAGLGLASTSFATMIAGDDDRAAVAFLGTTSAGNGFAQAFTGTWDLYVAYTYDAGATWTAVKATSDPVQRGWICTSGTTCDLGSAPMGRNLLDFMDATTDTIGRVVVGFADGCVDACADAGGAASLSTSARGTLARQSCGPSLFAANGNVEGSGACPVGLPPAPEPFTPQGAYYATGLTPANNVDGLARIFIPFGSLTTAAPGATPPKVAENGAGQHGSNAGTIWDAHWFLDASGAPIQLTDATVTVHLFVASQPAATALASTLRVAAFDGGSGGFADINAPILDANVDAPVGVSEVIVTFTHVTATLSSGFELHVDDLTDGDAQVLYDSSLTPTRVEFG